jgi:hypothetical protein
MKATPKKVFQSRFYNHIVRLLGGPARATVFFGSHPKIRQLEATVAERCYRNGSYGWTPKGSAEEWFRLVVKPLTFEEVSK